MKAIVLIKEGFEEVEALSVVDVLRRGEMNCELVGMDAMRVTSSHVTQDLIKKFLQVFIKIH